MKKIILMLGLFSVLGMAQAETQSSGYEFAGSTETGTTITCTYNLVVAGQVINSQSITLFKAAVAGCPMKQ